MQLFDVYPLTDLNIVRSENTCVYDEKGLQYLDMYGGHAVISIGHNHPHWKQKIREQMDQVSFYSNAVINPLQTGLAGLLGKISGKDTYRLFMCNSGAEANENALKLASFHTGRKQVVAFTKAFHGRTSLAVSATDNPGYIAPVNETDKVTFLPYNDEVALQEHFFHHGEEIAAVIIEAIQGVGGIRVATGSFLQRIRAMCDQYGALMIADEVQCGYGRTSTFFCMDHAGIDADIYTMAKGMGNGFPVGGIAIAPHIRATHGMLGTTFGGNHLACAAAIAVLEVFEKEELIENAKQVGNYLLQQLQSVESIKNVRGRGLMIGFDIPGYAKELKNQLFRQYRILTGEAQPDVIRLLPAMSIDRSTADRFLDSLQAAIKDLQ